jgi:hypothetical protein
MKAHTSITLDRIMAARRSGPPVRRLLRAIAAALRARRAHIAAVFALAAAEIRQIRADAKRRR